MDGDFTSDLRERFGRGRCGKSQVGPLTFFEYSLSLRLVGAKVASIRSVKHSQAKSVRPDRKAPIRRKILIEIPRAHRRFQRDAANDSIHVRARRRQFPCHSIVQHREALVQ